MVNEKQSLSVILHVRGDTASDDLCAAPSQLLPFVCEHLMPTWLNAKKKQRSMAVGLLVCWAEIVDVGPTILRTFLGQEY